MPPLFRWIGRVSPELSMLIFSGIAVIGAIGTVSIHREPGFLLGFMIIVGSVIAALCIRRKAVYLLIPLPALAYLVLSSVTGYIHDHTLGTSKTALASDVTQWLGGGFTGIGVATILVLLIFGARLLASRLLVSGRLPASVRRPPDGRSPRAPMPPPSRSGRDQRGGRAPWDDPRDRGRRDRQGERDAWYEQPRSGSRGRPSDNDQQRTRALPAPDVPPGRGASRNVPPGQAPRRPDDDRWRG